VKPASRVAAPAGRKKRLEVLKQFRVLLRSIKLDSLHADLAEVIRLMQHKDAKARSTPLSEL
jgi:hypothetical protein